MTKLTGELVLAMIADASDEERKAGLDGWVRPEDDAAATIVGDLIDSGYVERMEPGSSFVRPTDAGRQAVAPGRVQ